MKGGETLMITDRGRPIAVVHPYRSPDAELEELIEAGIVRPGRRPLDDDFWDLPRPADPEGKVLEALRERAEGLLRRHPLRAGDALQLAAALTWAQSRPKGMRFLSLDARLSEAADREGFTVIAT